jgi:hypothetical protein
MKHEKNGKSVKNYTMGEMSCKFPPPGGSIGPRFFSNFYLVKNHKTLQTLKLEKK